MSAPHPLCTRTETEMSLVWGENHPALFVEAVKRFQDETPITHWRHHVDLGRKGFITLIASRRPQPFESVQDYLKDGGPFLQEIGMTR
jgi:hypothetical protein